MASTLPKCKLRGDAATRLKELHSLSQADADWRLEIGGWRLGGL